MGPGTAILGRRPDRSDAAVECGMATIYYVVAGILLYLAADWLLGRIETRAGRILEHRTLVFFGLLAAMALISFALIRVLLER
jgi:hypothetical protein